MRVAILTNILSPYRLPVFADLVATPGWDVRIFVNAESEFDRTWDVDGSALPCERVPGWSYRRRTKTRGEIAFEQVATVHVPAGLFGCLRKFRPDVVVTAELGVRTLLAELYCKVHGIPCVVWSYHSRISKNTTGSLKTKLRRALLSSATTVVGMGTQAREYLHAHGVPDARIFDAPNAHDHATCERILATADLDAVRADWRTRGCRSKVAILSGRLVPMKGIPETIAAWNELPQDLRSEWTLAFLGGGPLQPVLDRAIAESAPGEIVHLGEVQPAEAMAAYAASDLMIFASLGDPWGLVANEAMALGTPVLCSRFAGCADDLIEPGVNGWLCDPTDVATFARELADALRSWNTPGLADAARATAWKHRPATMAGGIRNGVLAAMGQPPCTAPIDGARQDCSAGHSGFPERVLQGSGGVQEA